MLWNYDTADWTLGYPAPVYAVERVSQLLAQVLAGSKSPGLIILEHELNNGTVDIFKNSVWPDIQRNGWRPSPIGALYDLPSYQNAENNEGTAWPKTNMALGETEPPPSQTDPTNTESGGAEPSQTPTKTPRDGTAHLLPSLLYAVITAVIATFLA